jgi:hydroxypyruvate reductase
MVRATLPMLPTPPRAGLVVVHDGPWPEDLPLPLHRAAHPDPDARGEAAARHLEDLVADDPGGPVLVLLSGGASALLPAPAPGLTLAEKRATSAALMATRATIHQLNAVRKHLSRLKGGRLGARLGPRPTRVLALSDVPGDDPSVIASGPFSPDPTTFAEALALLPEEAPPAARQVLEEGARGERPESPKPGDGTLDHVDYEVVASGRVAAAAAAGAAPEGWRVEVLPEPLQGTPTEAATRLHAALDSLPPGAPRMVLAPGELTLDLGPAPGKGGRAQTFSLAAALDAPPGRWCGALGTDGRDGPTDAAGALLAPGALTGEDARRDASRALAARDAYPFLDRLGALLRTGPTGTNLGDLYLVAEIP